MRIDNIKVASLPVVRLHSWVGEKTITIQWRMKEPLPKHLLTRFEVDKG